ncbi:MAG: hypothetical protein E2598_07520 [Sphingobium sp.]|nr:hypothetical protein [Sphingobium sp.]
MQQIILNTAKPIARLKDHPGKPVYTGAGTTLNVPSAGLTKEQAAAWVKDGSASPVETAPAKGAQ